MTRSADTPAGGVIAGYEVKRLLGRGGMGDVYLAFDPRLERPVALKVLAPQLAEDEGFRARLLRESRLAAGLDHPNVVPVYDAGEDAGVLFIAMRYVDGTDLRELLRTEGPLAPERIIAIGAQLAGALDTAHARGLVHRDVKPSNVLIDRAEGREHCYLADFGLSQSISARPVTDGDLMGTIDYVAPEQIRGDAVDGRADVYALGCLLYEALVGERPFDRSSDVATIFAHLEEDPTPPSERRAELPDAIDPVLVRAMAKDPAERYETCAALVEDARVALHVGRATRRRRWLVLAALGSAAVVAALAAVIAGTRDSAVAAPPVGAMVRIGTESGEVEGRYALDVVPTHVTAAAGDVWFAAGDALWRLDPDGGKPVKVETVGAIDDLTALGSTVYVAMQGKTFAEGLVVPYFADGIRGDGLGLRACSLGGHASVGLWAADCASVHRLETRLGRPSIASTVVVPPLEPVSTGTTRWCLCDIAVGDGDVWVVGDAVDRRLWRIAPGGRIEATVELPVAPRSIATTPGAVWVSAPLDDVLVEVDTRTNEVVDQVAVGRSPAGVTAAGDAVWVASQLDGTVARLDSATGEVTDEVAVGGRPAELVVAGDAVWVTVDERA